MAQAPDSASNDLGDNRLHKLCHKGKLTKIVDFFQSVDKGSIAGRLSSRKGVFGYTPLHEAVAGNKFETLGFLLDKIRELNISQTSDKHPLNCKANSGYTPLHLAASSGHEKCVDVLIKKGANIFVLDDYNKTPKQTAELGAKSSVVTMLRSEELVKAVENSNPNAVRELLKDDTSSLDRECVHRSFITATTNDAHAILELLLKIGPVHVEECLKIATEQKKSNTRALLLLVRAALTNNITIVRTLFEKQGGEVVEGFPEGLVGEDLADVQQAIATNKPSTASSIKFASVRNNSAVQVELLMNTKLNKSKGYIIWSNLELRVLDSSWIGRISWVSKLDLGSNCLQELPQEITLLKKLSTVTLAHNQLSEIPRSLLCLPYLKKLNLSHNKLLQLPEITEWSKDLIDLDVSQNRLSRLPKAVKAPALQKLDISYNRFREVPPCVCTFQNLSRLLLSHNPDILVLPPELGLLKSLVVLQIDGLKDLNDPPKSFHNDTNQCLIYLKQKLRGDKEFYGMKLMLVGYADRGKTTLVARLKGKKIGENRSTVGIDITEWEEQKPGMFGLFSKKFHFSIWDFGGQEEYYATHQCFLSQKALYLVLFDLRHGEKGVKEVVHWLNNIAVRAPESKAIIVGTHLDECTVEQQQDLETLYQKMQFHVQPYKSKLQIYERVIPIGIKDDMKELKETIYNEADSFQLNNVPVMGRKIPTSYHRLDENLQLIQKQVRNSRRDPIMNFEEFQKMVQETDLPDLQGEDELQTAVVFLTEIGTILHYDDRSNGLHKLYFIYPRWLCDMMATIVTIKEINPYVRNGILKRADFPQIYRDTRFPLEYRDQYIALLDHFEIALSLDDKHILIPSMLQEERPTDLIFDARQPFYSRYFQFKQANTPPGFWSRLLCRIMHSVKQVKNILHKTVPSSTHPQQLLSPDQQTPLESSEMSTSEQTVGRLKYWKTGLYYSDEQVTFCIEALEGCGRSDKDGVYITTSMNTVGTDIACQFIDLVRTLLEEWYSGIKPDEYEQKVECPECVKLRLEDPHMFDVNMCFMQVLKGKTGAKCSKSDIVPHRDIVELADIVPDLLFKDIDEKFHLKPSEIELSDDVLGRGGFGEVLRGRYKDINVAVKKCIQDKKQDTQDKKQGSQDKEQDVQDKKVKAKEKKREDPRKVYNSFATEARFLYKLRHPCLVSLIGVCKYTDLLALVLEEAPGKSVSEAIVKNTEPIDRIVIYRIAMQVAAALRFLHGRNVIFRDLKADNVLLWSLDPESLCHCKVADFGIASYLSPLGAKGLKGTKGFIAPEVSEFGKKKSSVYNHKADIFSFAMFLYQLICRRNPFHDDLLPQEIDVAFQQGKRPKTSDIPAARSSFHFLAQLMEACWQSDPADRPETDAIIANLCRTTVQTVCCVNPIKCKFDSFTGRNAIAALKTDDTEETSTPRSEVWVTGLASRNDTIGSGMLFIDTQTLQERQMYLEGKYVECMLQCEGFIWLGTRTDTDGTIEIFNVNTHRHVHTVKMRGSSVSSMAYSEDTMYVGTREGFIFMFPTDVNTIKTSSQCPPYKFIAQNVVSGIAYIKPSPRKKANLWVSLGKSLYFLPKENKLSRSRYPAQTRKELIGKLLLTPDNRQVWSCHAGSSTIVAWNALSRAHLFDIDVALHLSRLNNNNTLPKHDTAITTITLACDTVWAGTASGHILVFKQDKLLSWYQPYNNYIQFLTCAPRNGTHIVVSGALCYTPFVEDLRKERPREPNEEERQHTKREDSREKEPQRDDGTIMFWEAYTSQTIKQIKLVEESAPDVYNNHDNVRDLIRQGNFKDGTNISLMFQPESNPLSTSALSENVQPRTTPAPKLPQSTASAKTPESESEQLSPSSTGTHDLSPTEILTSPEIEIHDYSHSPVRDEQRSDFPLMGSSPNFTAISPSTSPTPPPPIIVSSVYLNGEQEVTTNGTDSALDTFVSTLSDNDDFDPLTPVMTSSQTGDLRVTDDDPPVGDDSSSNKAMEGVDVDSEASSNKLVEQVPILDDTPS